MIYDWLAFCSVILLAEAEERTLDMTFSVSFMLRDVEADQS